MTIGLDNFALYLWHGYSRVSPAHHAHTLWSVDSLQAHADRTERWRTQAHHDGRHALACGLHVHREALQGALAVRDVAARLVTDPIDLILGTGCFAPQATPVYEAPGEALEKLLTRPVDSGLVGLVALGLFALKVGYFAVAGCLVGAAIGGWRPRGELERDAVRGLKIGANVGAAVAALLGVQLLLALNAARLGSASLKACITGVAYAVVLPGALLATLHAARADRGDLPATAGASG